METLKKVFQWLGWFLFLALVFFILGLSGTQTARDFLQLDEIEKQRQEEVKQYQDMIKDLKSQAK